MQEVNSLTAFGAERNYVIKFLFRSVWGTPKWRGLRVGTVGFLTVASGALIAFLGGMLRDMAADPLLHALATILLYCGWTLLILGTGIGFFGIFVGWWFLFYKADE
jgi:hypothetical protein